ncbi:MAG: hypothetical protein WC558_16175 [Patulibacter sp.]
MRRFIAMIALGVLPLAGCGGASDSVTVSATTTRATVETQPIPPAESDAPYRFIKPPLVVMSRAGSSWASPLFKVMVRVKPPLPRRTNPNRASTFSMRLDGVSQSVMSRESDECYQAWFDRSMAESGGPQNPPPEIFVRPKVGKKVMVSVLYRPGRGEKFRSFSTEVKIRRPSRALWDDFDRLGLKQQGCKLR